MFAKQKWTCFWPGLPRMWVCGDPSGLRPALVFTVLLNATIIASFLWPWRFPLMVTILLWTLVVTIWGLSFWTTWRRFPELPKEHATLYEGLFLRAQAEYLRGEHFSAEAALNRLLKHRPQDVEARLLLAGVYRRTDRCDQARKQLRRLARTGGPKWAMEVARELQLLDEAEQAGSQEPESDALMAA